MNTPATFYPSRRLGLIFQVGVSIVLAVSCAACFFRALDERSGQFFVIFLVLALVFLAPIPVLVYRIYGLLGAYYTLDRDGIRIHWGLRVEEIPLPDIEWIRFTSDLYSLYLPVVPTQPHSLPLPRLRWPGSLIGARQIEGLGKVEFIASEKNNLLLIATSQRTFVISPTDPQGFIRAFNRLNEMGSLAPLSARSVYPTFLAARIWDDQWSRTLLFSGIALGLIMLVWVGLAIPTHTSISLGFSPNGVPLEAGPSEHLLLLPVLYGLSYLASLFLGMFFFRRPEQKNLAYLVWATNLVEGALLLVAVGKAL